MCRADHFINSTSEEAKLVGIADGSIVSAKNELCFKLANFLNFIA